MVVEMSTTHLVVFVRPADLCRDVQGDCPVVEGVVAGLGGQHHSGAGRGGHGAALHLKILLKKSTFISSIDC